MPTNGYAAQQRQATRTRGGRYDKGPACDLCGHPAGWNYCSAPTPPPLVVCSRKACQRALQRITAEQHAACRAADPTWGIDAQGYDHYLHQQGPVPA